MRNRKALVAAGLGAVLLLAGGCGTGEDGSSEAVADVDPSPTVGPVATVVLDEPRLLSDGGEEGDEAAAEEEAEPVEVDLLDVSTASFSNPTQIDNPYKPLVPGTRRVFEGVAMDGDEEVERMIINIVTDLTKEINGVQTVVIWERDYNDGELAEAEIAFFAQDDDGNVWHFGQYYEIWDEDGFAGGRIWVVDVPEGARGGILMPADPQAGGPPYSQGFAPEPFNWSDTAAVAELGTEYCIEDECFQDVLVTEETDRANVGAFQLKYYAPGIGNIGVGWRGPDPEQEVMDMVEDVVLTESELIEARNEALALEERGYLYSLTKPAMAGD